MSAPIPLTKWQNETTPDVLPRHIRRAIVPGYGGCWLWRNSISDDGYGWASLNNKTHQAHRLVYVLLRGEPEPGLVLDHLCRVRWCVNPDHLEAVTMRENLRRGNTQAGWQNCQKCGGPFTQLPTQRRCLNCRRAYEQSRGNAA